MDTLIDSLRQRYPTQPEKDAQLLKLIETSAKEATFNVGLMKNLISAGANVNAKNAFGYSPLMIAVRDCRRNIITALVDIKGISVNDTTPYDRTALHIAASRGDAFAVTALLSVTGIVLNKADPKGTTPLMEAARLGHTDVVSVLLADSRILECVNEIRQSDGYTALMLAIQSNHTQAANRLLKAKDINVHTLALNGHNAISLAQQNANFFVNHQLLSLGAVLPEPVKIDARVEHTDKTLEHKESRSESPSTPLLQPFPMVIFSDTARPVGVSPTPKNLFASTIDKLKKMRFG